MALTLVNTLTGDRARFDPAEDEVRLYFCGLTVNDRAHLGHARSWVHVDVLRRWLEHRGHRVRHVENFTDVNEKIVARVGERPGWHDERAVAEYYIERTLADMRALHLRRAHAYPRVTEHIGEIVAMIEALVAAEHAYVAEDGSVYFDVTSVEDYGVLSGQSPEELRPSEDDHPEKRHPADFALWKAGGVASAEIDEHRTEASAPAEEAVAGAQTWPSPWGDGRPGWHIECSAMSTAHLGETFDIHVAGRDIIFPHNENEIVQAEAATGAHYARCWVHVDMLEIDEEKMSTSLQNFTTVDAAIERYGANVLRTFLLSTSHDARQAFTDASIEEAETRFERLRRAAERAGEALDSPMASPTVADDVLRDAVETARDGAAEALDDNLDTRGALGALGELAAAIQRHVDAGDPPYDYGGLLDALSALESFGTEVLGLRFATGEDGRRLDRVLEELLAFREGLRAAEAYEHADALRAHLATAGVEVEDTDAGARYRIARDGAG